MAPPMRMVSAFSKSRSMTLILSLTLAPPRMTTNGRAGFSSSSPRNFSSRSMSRPAAAWPPQARTMRATPLVEAWARCAAPKASFTYTSAKRARRAANTGSLASSSAWNRTFSRTRISPSFNAAAAASAFSPTVSSTKATGRPIIWPSFAATGARLIEGSRLPSGRPRCAARMMRAPLETSSSRVGRVSLMRVVSLITITPSFSSIGTL